MRPELVNQIIKNNSLIPGKISRIILNKIINDEKIRQKDLPDNVNLKQILELKKFYKLKVVELQDNKIKPRYFAFYLIIQDKYPSFSWNKEYTLYSPRINNVRPSLLSLLLGQVVDESDTLLHRKYFNITQLPHEVIKKLNEFIKLNDVYYPPVNEMDEIIKFLLAGLNKNKLNIFIPLCPDYSFKFTNNQKCLVEFTFDKLGCENGIIAQWILKVIKNLADFFINCGIETDFIIAMADFEAFSEENLKTFNITKDEFLKRVFLSKESFKKSCPISAKVIMFSELCNEKKWIEHIETIKKMFLQNNFGESVIDKKLLQTIVANRKSLYSKWYGEKSSLEEYIQIALNQGTMYAAMGKVITEHFKNCLVFAADNKIMRFFYSVTNKIPTLYVDKKYS